MVQGTLKVVQIDWEAEFSGVLPQSGTLWYLSLIFSNVIIFSNITKNGSSFVPKMKMSCPKMAMVIFKLLYLIPGLL